MESRRALGLRVGLNDALADALSDALAAGSLVGLAHGSFEGGVGGVGGVGGFDCGARRSSAKGPEPPRAELEASKGLSAKGKTASC